MTELKYQTQVESIPDCPCCKERIPDKVYRFVQHNPLDYSDFIPKAIKTPDKINHFSNPDRCLNHGISLFDSMANAMLRYESFSNKLKLKKGFRFIAEGVLNESDGIAHKSTASKGHLTFYEGKDIELLSKFEKIRELS